MELNIGLLLEVFNNFIGVLMVDVEGDVKLLVRNCVGFLDMLEYIFRLFFLVFSDVFSMVIVCFGYFVLGSIFLFILFIIGECDFSIFFVFGGLVVKMSDSWFSIVGVVLENILSV